MNSWCLNSHLQTNTQNLAKPNQTHKPKLYLKGFPHPPLEKKIRKLYTPSFIILVESSSWIFFANQCFEIVGRLRSINRNPSHDFSCGPNDDHMQGWNSAALGLRPVLTTKKNGTEILLIKTKLGRCWKWFHAIICFIFAFLNVKIDKSIVQKSHNIRTSVSWLLSKINSPYQVG